MLEHRCCGDVEGTSNSAWIAVRRMWRSDPAGREPTQRVSEIACCRDLYEVAHSRRLSYGLRPYWRRQDVLRVITYADETFGQSASARAGSQAARTDRRAAVHVPR